MKPGDLITVIDFGGGSPLFPDGWKRGESPIMVHGRTHGVVLDTKLEDDGPNSSLHNPRTFLQVVTPVGVGWINSVYCEVVSEPG